MHRNPVKRGLAKKPEDWDWSSFRAYAFQQVAPVRVNCQEWPLMTLPSECVSLNRPGFEDLIHPRHRRGGGNVGIGLIDFQGLWEGRKTAPSFSGLPTNHHFHGLL